MVSVWSATFSWTGLREIDENQRRETSKNNVVKILDGMQREKHKTGKGSKGISSVRKAVIWGVPNS